MDDTPLIRAVLGQVTHADGTTTYGVHVRDEDGVMTLVDLTEETIDWERWAWAVREAGRLLSSPYTEEDHDA